ncbi:MAG TPA: DUF2652 domain-containing protein [Rubricoccaceae bacterium]|nr:DUF2652 domain-containing protein [Rubricoccaceae bacterium]
MTTPAVLLVADISGFTRFMRLHALATSHARQIIVRLLEALVHAAQPPLTVAELEGDAVFFYAPAPDGDLDRVAAEVKTQVLRLFRAFEQEAAALAAAPLCVCEACLSVRDLKLKQVAHAGEVAVEKVGGRFEKLFGIDVIVVHRMLKNSVPSPEYVMLTEPAFAAGAGFHACEPERRTEVFEGIGPTETLVVYRPALDGPLAALTDVPAPPTLPATLGWKLKMHARTIAELLRLRRKPRPAAPALVTA